MNCPRQIYLNNSPPFSLFSFNTSLAERGAGKQSPDVSHLRQKQWIDYENAIQSVVMDANLVNYEFWKWTLKGKSEGNHHATLNSSQSNQMEPTKRCNIFKSATSLPVPSHQLIRKTKTTEENFDIDRLNKLTSRGNVDNNSIECQYYDSVRLNIRWSRSPLGEY